MDGYWVNDCYYTATGFSVPFFSVPFFSEPEPEAYQPKNAIMSLLAYGEQDRMLSNSSKKIEFLTINHILSSVID